MQQNKYISKISDKDLEELMMIVKSVVHGIDIKKLYDVARKAGRNKKQYTVDPEYMQLLQRWYDSNRLDYDVYNEHLYLVDAWVSWRVYSRMQIYQMTRRINEIKKIVNIDGIDTIVDLGGGIGYSTLALKELFSPSRVYTTQIEGTDQYKICKFIFKNIDNAEVIPNVSKLDNADIVFASEYFEHFTHPIHHLNEIIKLNPKIIIVANSFGVDDAIGHFTEYYDLNNVPHKGKKISRIFNDRLREAGYDNKQIRFYNNLPAFFVRKDCIL